MLKHKKEAYKAKFCWLYWDSRESNLLYVKIILLSNRKAGLALDFTKICTCYYPPKILLIQTGYGQKNIKMSSKLSAYYIFS